MHAPERSRSPCTVSEVTDRGRLADGSRLRLTHRTPHSLITELTNMGNYALSYGISKRTPAPPKVLREILDAQEAVNRACTWSHERLALTAPKEAARPSFGLPLARFGFVTGQPPATSQGLASAEPSLSLDALVQGSTRVRDNLWNAHVVAAFFRRVSREHPALLFELRDEGGFVLPVSVWIRGGKVEANQDFLNRERSRVLEVTGDPNAAGPYVWAELQALGGNFFQDAPVSEYAELSEIRELDLSWDQLESLSLSDLADHVVENATKAAVPVRA